MLYTKTLCNGPLVARAVIHSLIHSAFSSKSSKLPHSQTVRASGLNFWINVHPYHMSLGTCPRHVSHFMCHVLCITCCGASRWRVCYWWGLHRLFLAKTIIYGDTFFSRNLIEMVRWTYSYDIHEIVGLQLSCLIPPCILKRWKISQTDSFF